MVFLDLLRTSWVYKEWKEEGIQEGRQEGRQEALQETLLKMVETRFPALLPKARELVPGIQDTFFLQRTIINISIARTADEAEGYLTLDQK